VIKLNLNKKLLGKRIKQARENRKLTQEKLAEIIGVSTVYVSHLEIGSKLPSLETLVKISNSLDISVDYLLSNDVNTAKEYLESDLAKLVKDCSSNDMNLIITIVKAIVENKKS
jgi:transcriptional regulator with XRE-family HTH domain